MNDERLQTALSAPAEPAVAKSNIGPFKPSIYSHELWERPLWLPVMWRVEARRERECVNYRWCIPAAAALNRRANQTKPDVACSFTFMRTHTDIEDQSLA